MQMLNSMQDSIRSSICQALNIPYLFQRSTDMINKR